jgi:hypothetical protein
MELFLEIVSLLRNFLYLQKKEVNERFEVKFLKEADEFLTIINDDAREKILYNIYKARAINDENLFKKLTSEIWEFRTLFNKIQYRLFAFWDNEDKSFTIVLCTHGIIKKTRKTPVSELKKATEIMKAYFKNKIRKDGNK